MKYNIIITDKADEQIRNIILYIRERFGNEIALEKMMELERNILILKDNPELGILPNYLVLKRQGYRVLILEKNLVFYKVNFEKKEIIIYAIIDQRQDFLNIIRGL